MNTTRQRYSRYAFVIVYTYVSEKSIANIQLM